MPTPLPLAPTILLTTLADAAPKTIAVSPDADTRGVTRVLARDPEAVKRAQRKKKSGDPDFGQIAAGPYVAVTRVRGTDADATVRELGYGLIRTFGYWTTGPWVSRFSLQTLLSDRAGGGSASLATGYRYDLGPGPDDRVEGTGLGPFARAGGTVALGGNSRFYLSTVELPRGELGFQWAEPLMMLEARGFAAPVLVGRFSPGADLRRRLGGALAWGLEAAWHTSIVHLETSFERIQAARPVTLLTGLLCSQPSFLSLCTEARYDRGDAGGSGNEVYHASAVYLGWSIGVGFNQTA